LTPEFLRAFSPQAVRILRLAEIESSADRSQHGDSVNAEHLLVAMAQEGNNLGAELIDAAGLTIADVRAGRVRPAASPAATAAAKVT